MTHPRRVAIIGGLALAAVVAMLFVDPIPQDLEYHDFADRRPWLGIPNFGDVASNIPFALVGAAGLCLLFRRKDLVGPRRPFLAPAERRAWIIVFFGVFATAFGSAYYHWAPDNPRLAWDRLPMTVVFMSLFSIQIMERISLRAGVRLLAPLLMVGAGSIISWHLTEVRGKGDLRLYALVQFYPILAIPLLLALFPPRYTRTDLLVWPLVWYIVAKVFEELDRGVWNLTGQMMSGHTLKHLAAGVGMGCLVRLVMKRRALGEEEGATVRPGSGASLP